MKEILDFLFELGMLKRVKVSGNWLVGYDGNNIAEHSYRAIFIGYVLAKLEKVDENKVIKMLLFHDIPETRILDMNKVSARYIDKHNAEKKVLADQVMNMPLDIKEEVSDLFNELEKRETQEAMIAKEADYLEAAISAKEAIEKGYLEMKDWIENVKRFVKTKSAKKLIEELENSNSNEWWHNIKYIKEIGRGEKI